MFAKRRSRRRRQFVSGGCARRGARRGSPEVLTPESERLSVGRASWSVFGVPLCRPLRVVPWYDIYVLFFFFFTISSQSRCGKKKTVIFFSLILLQSFFDHLLRKTTETNYKVSNLLIIQHNNDISVDTYTFITWTKLWKITIILFTSTILYTYKKLYCSIIVRYR